MKKSFLKYIGNRYDLRKISAFTLLTILLTTVAKGVFNAPVLAGAIATAYIIFCGLFLYFSIVAFNRYTK